MLISAEDILNGFLGGLLIGTAAALFLLLNGRIAGISGLLFGVFSTPAKRLENLLFMAGLIGTPLLFTLLVAKPEIGLTTSPLLLGAAGLLVGFGTRLGNGCTSGHGICGLSRFSVRSLAATGTFMAVAIGTVAVTRFVIGGL